MKASWIDWLAEEGCCWDDVGRWAQSNVGRLNEALARYPRLSTWSPQSPAIAAAGMGSCTGLAKGGASHSSLRAPVAGACSGVVSGDHMGLDPASQG